MPNIPMPSDNGPNKGGVDLNLFKKPNAAERKQIHAVVRNWLLQQGFICPCGEFVAEDGVKILAYGERMVQGPQGTAQPGVDFDLLTFHSRDCAAFKAKLDEIEAHDKRLLAIVKLPVIEWVEQIELMDR